MFTWSIKVDGNTIKDGFKSIYPALEYVENNIGEIDALDYTELEDCSGYVLNANSIEFVKEAK